MKWFTVVFAIFLCVAPLRGDDSLSQQVVEGYQQWRGGHANAAIAVLEPLVQPTSKISNEHNRGVAWSVLGSSYLDVERFEDARRAYEQALLILHRLPGARAEYASALDNLGLLQQSLGNAQAAKPLCTKAQRIYEALANPDGIAITATNLAVIAYVEHDFNAARRSIARAEEEAQKTTGLREDDLAALDAMSGAMALHDGRNGEAMTFIQRAIDRWTRTYGLDYFMVANGYLLRAQVLASSGDHARAMTDAGHGLARAEALWGKNSVGYLNAQAAYSRVLWMCGEKKEAKRLANESSQALAVLQQQQCSGCTINANGFR